MSMRSGVSLNRPLEETSLRRPSKETDPSPQFCKGGSSVLQHCLCGPANQPWPDRKGLNAEQRGTITQPEVLLLREALQIGNRPKGRDLFIVRPPFP